MFSPDGFMPLNEIASVCWTIAEDRYPRADPWDMFGADVRARLYAELLLSRFLADKSSQMWVFQYPDITLKAWPELFGRTRTYEGPCPQDPEEAESALRHLEAGPWLFITKKYRVTADVHQEDIDVWGLEDAVEAAKHLQGALVCWKPDEWPSDLERVLAPYRDEVHFRGHPHLPPIVGESMERAGLVSAWEAFNEICPDGKEASGLTWEQVVKHTGWSRRQILRAIGANGGQKCGQ